MNLRVDTDVVRGGGKQVQSMNDRLAATLTTAESTLQSAASGVGQPAVQTALEDLLATMRTTHPQVTTSLGAFAREVEIAADVIDQTDVQLGAAVPETP